MAVERYGSKTDVIVKLVLVFFVCLLSFSIGTFVGKKFSDNQHKIAKYEPRAQEQTADRGMASVNPEETEVKPTEALTDDEVAKLAEEFVTDEKGEEKKEEAHPVLAEDHHAEETTEAKANEKGHSIEKAHAPEPKVKAEKTEHQVEKAAHATAANAAPMKAAEKVAHNQAPDKVEKQAGHQNRIPTSLPKEMAGASVGKYTVQVASYPEENDAQKMASDLKGKGFSAFYVSAKVKDRKTNTEKTWYRVSVGLFTTQKEAEAYKADLLTRSKVQSAIVQKIVE
jgi:cell division protein FtsN